jgi:hypothetical protein
MDVHCGQQSVDGAVSAVPTVKVFTQRNEIDTDLWNDLLLHSDVATFFQSPTCYDLYAEQDFMEPFVVAVGSDELLEVLICGQH